MGRAGDLPGQQGILENHNNSDRKWEYKGKKKVSNRSMRNGGT